MKRLHKIALAFAATAIAMMIAPAHADVGVTIDQNEGSTIFSAPTLPDGVSYPEQVNTTLTGTASFSSAEGAVFAQLLQAAPYGEVNPDDPGSITGPGDEVVIYTGQADCVIVANACAWSFRIPFFTAPGNYTAKVWAGEPNATDPNEPGPVATASIGITIL